MYGCVLAEYQPRKWDQDKQSNIIINPGVKFTNFVGISERESNGDRLVGLNGRDGICANGWVRIK